MSALTPVTPEQGRVAIIAALDAIIELVRKADAGRYGLHPARNDNDVVLNTITGFTGAVETFARLLAPGVPDADMADVAWLLADQFEANRERDEAANAEPDPLAVAIHRRARGFL